MTEYKCISCGAVKESQKCCSCPNCGYKMFEAPFIREETLKKEIRNFISQLMLCKVDSSSFRIYRQVTKVSDNKSGDNTLEYISKERDDQRFPGFAKIQGYVCSAEKTEIFYERLTTSLNEIKKYIHTPYEQNYTVSLEHLKSEINSLDVIMRQAMQELSINVALVEANVSDLKLLYSETPNATLIPIADELIDNLFLLADKIVKFIRQNNMYGTAYQKKPKRTHRSTDIHSCQNDLKKYISLTSKTLAKKYVVDIFSDGTEELGEMLKALWGSIDIILSSPILEKNSMYTFDDGIVALNNEVKNELLERIGKRYIDIDSIIYSTDFLSDLSENALFDAYNRMIELDSEGIMGVNKNALFILGESEKKLDNLIGLNEIKESIKKIKAYALANKDSGDLNIHMCFLGNPGTGKTEVARYIADILYENKILPTNKVIEVDRSGLVSQYFGATAEKTSRVISSAMGGVLFIDEAYALGNNADFGNTDYGKEAIDTLVKAMEDHRGKFCVILAGYKNEMLQMLSVNPGFKSRIQFMLDFPNYSRSELESITKLMLDDRHYTIGDSAMNKLLDITDIKRKDPNFANAREIRNILDQVIMCQNMRCVGTNDTELGIIDVNKYIQDSKINLPISDTDFERKVLSGEEELDRLIGLDSVKRMVRKIKAYAKRNKGDADFNLHMCFYGNPGTGKTEVARIISRILYDAGVLDEAKLIETDGHGLLGMHVGETAPKTEAKINDAMNGVLFIDEAYSLAGSNAAAGVSFGYGEEAISVLLKEMEDRRGQFCVILAGYKNEMLNMLSTNPGFKSRIQFTLDFPDYTREELGRIAQAFLSKKKYEIDEDALERLLDIIEYFRSSADFANARTVRNILDQVLMNQNLRTEDAEDDRTVIISDVEDYLTDEGIDLDNLSQSNVKIGFI